MNDPTVVQPTEESSGAKPKRAGWWLDTLLFVCLVLAAIPVRYVHTVGDLWGDEADYALASAYPMGQQRWDNAGERANPLRLVQLRHYHPPVTALLLRVAQIFGSDDRTLRLPFVLAGSLAVGLTYLCGLALLDGRREVAAACAIIVLLTPMQLRVAAHAIPWVLITLGLLGLLWPLMQYARTRQPGWILGAWAVLGLLFVTTESFFPMLLSCGVSAPLLFWPVLRQPEERARILKAMGWGVAVFLLIVLAIWPRGLFGGAWQNLHHYMLVPPESVPVTLGQIAYPVAPKWAFLYWYWHDYRPYFLFYTLGGLTALILAVRRQLSRAAGVLLIFTAVEVAVAHAAIIPAPHYLAHCLPLLTLLFGLLLWRVVLVKRLIGWGVMALLCGYLAFWQPRFLVRENDQEAEVTRWPLAAVWLAQRWQPRDRLLVGPQPVGVARWYLLHRAHLPATIGQILPLAPDHIRPALWKQITAGAYRYLVLSHPFDSKQPLAPELAALLAKAEPGWQSRERRNGPPRLIVYVLPRPLNPRPLLPLRGEGEM